MPKNDRRHASIGIAAAAAAFLFIAAAAPATSATYDAPDATSGLEYVALGDSYSAGFGLIPYSEAPAAGCYQALADYPHLVAAELGLTLDDRTCSGAETANIRDVPQPTITGEGTAPVQSDSLSSSTDIVTVTIGGNDLGFSDIAAFCLAASATGPLLSDIYDNCKDKYAPIIGGIEVDTLKDLIDSTITTDLDATFALIAQKAPNAKVFVIGYPTLSPDFANVPTGGCFSSALSDSPPYPQNSFPFTDVDTAYLHGTEVRLDKAIQAAAEANGATYLSTLAGTATRSACAAPSDAYINGISLITPSEGQGTPTGLPGLLVRLGALHPNAAGVAYLTETVSAAISDVIESTPPPVPGPSLSPTPSPVPTTTTTSTEPDGQFGSALGRELAPTGSTLSPLIVIGTFALVTGGIGLVLVAARRRRVTR